MNFKTPLVSPIKFGIISKVLPTKGNLAWEYQPFKNYRLTEPKYYFRNKYFSKVELEKELGKEISPNLQNWNEYKYPKLPNGITKYEDDPVFYDTNSLVDFDTSELNFDIKHPVDILPQYSYDGSVNLIINDGKNTPKLINSRFSALGKHMYQIVDRTGEADTNIYDSGTQFNTDVSLYKTYINIPKLQFVNVFQGGNLSVGNYHFYFKLSDSDGNETDFVAESGLVSIFKGNTFNSINTGFRNERSNKSVKFLLANIDTAYPYVQVYYTRATGDINTQASISAYKIEQKFLVNNSSLSDIFITGNEETTEISIDQINPYYQIANNVQTQAQCQNMLFFGNIQSNTVNSKELSDISLRFTATVNSSKTYKHVPHDYSVSVNNTYADPKFIYNYLGYQKEELYRFGIVYLLDNGSLSPVFNIRGINLKQASVYANQPIYSSDGKRQYISYNEESGIVYSRDSNTTSENIYGVLNIISGADEFSTVFGIDINIQDRENVIKELKKHKVKGYFFVRQQRMPLRLCQAYTVGIDIESKTPLLPVSQGSVTERFINDSREFTHNFSERVYKIEDQHIKYCGAICPDYDINSPFYNSLFNGDEYYVSSLGTSRLKQDLGELRHFYTSGFDTFNLNKTDIKTKIIGVEDNAKLVEVDSKIFSARAGEAEEGFRFEYILSKNKTSEAINLLRGVYGPYLGLGSYNHIGECINIYLKDYKEMSYSELVKIRGNDKSSFYAISDRLEIDDLNSITLYRGDSYICTYTHRVNRNFKDPAAPNNHIIVNHRGWKDNYFVENNNLDYEKFSKINLGDINAVQLGMWVTLPIISNNNLNVRSLDESHVDETILMGSARGFYPYYDILVDGSRKNPEALCYNKGFTKNLSERYNYELPGVPSYKNDFTNRISYSDIHVNDAFKNGYRVFQGTHYRDYPKTYGQIIKLIELNGNLLCVFEHGIALIPVNERVLSGEGTGGKMYINSNNVLPENPYIISDTYGSQWKDSIIKTPQGIYGVDTVAKKIWYTNGKAVQLISDFKIQKFLNDNISLKEREINPILGIRNVKTHYNKYKGDVMFTFYDNLYGHEEKVWNICYNELLQKWITFYSWLPSESSNIQNQFFSFDRETTKHISKLGISNVNSSFADGVCLSNNIIDEKSEDLVIGDLSLLNRTLPKGNNINIEVSYSLEHDSLGHYRYFDIKHIGDKYKLVRTVPTENLCYEKFVRGVKKNTKYTPKITDLTKPEQIELWKNNCLLSKKYTVCKDETGRNIELNKSHNSLVYYLNIKANIRVIYSGTSNIAEAYSNSLKQNIELDAGYYMSTVAVTTKYNLQFLTTDFWKHGNSGIIDIKDKVKPTHWYGKQHPFEIEFIVNDLPQVHKIFDNLEIISNNAEPESFHYEIVGDSYEFAKDKKNIYIRQEATKELYQHNGSHISYDRDYINLNEEQRKINHFNDKSTIFPLYYSREDNINTIEDYYHLKEGYPTRDFSSLTGTEVFHNKTLNEYSLWNHSKATNLQDKGRLRGNMEYKEDKWYVQINPINFVQQNEKDWKNNLIPIELGQSPIPSDIKLESDIPKLTIPDNSINRDIVIWNWELNSLQETKLKDKWIKIRVRYSGRQLAIITAIKTLYTISYV